MKTIKEIICQLMVEMEEIPIDKAEANFEKWKDDKEVASFIRAMKTFATEALKEAANNVSVTFNDEDYIAKGSILSLINELK